jgi:hypothetical protein
VRWRSHCREEIRVRCETCTRADSLCTHSRCYFRPDASDGGASRRYRSSFAPPFHARSILRRVSSPYPRTLVIPSPCTKGSIHSLTPRLSLSPGRLRRSLIFTARVSPVARMLPKLLVNGTKLIDRSIDRRFLHTYTYTYTRTVLLAFRRCFPFSLFFSFSVSSRLRRRDTDDTRY